MKRNYKIASLTIVYNQELYLYHCLKSIYGYVDRLIILYSDKPWIDYNKNARRKYKTSDDSLEIIKNFPDPDKKIILIEGEWDNDESERNEGLDKIKELGYDYCFIVDADEIWGQSDLIKLLRKLNGNPVYELYRCKFILFWKSFEYVVWPFDELANVVVKISPDVKFEWSRNVNTNNNIILNNINYYHFAYVLPTDRMREKIDTWGHANQIRKEWFKKIYNNPYVIKNIHPIHPELWKGIIKYDKNKLPEIIKTHPYYNL